MSTATVENPIKQSTGTFAVIANRAALLSSLKMMAFAGQGRTPKPVLQCVLLEAGENTLSISATNLEAASSAEITQVEIEAPGVCAIHCLKLLEIIGAAEGDTVKMQVNGEQFQVSGDSEAWKMYTMPAEELPPIPKDVAGVKFSIGVKTLHDAFKSVRFASRDSMGEGAAARGLVNNAVCLVFDGKNLDCFATDGKRVAMREFVTLDSSPDKATAIVSIDQLPAILALMEECDGGENIDVSVGESQCSFQTSNGTVVVTMLQGAAPPVRDFMPKDHAGQLTCSREAFLKAVNKCRIACSEECKGVKLTITKRGVELSARSPEHGSSTANMPCKVMGPDVAIGLNGKYLADAISFCTSDEVTFEWNAANRPVRITGASGEIVVMMPVNLQD